MCFVKPSEPSHYIAVPWLEVIVERPWEMDGGGWGILCRDRDVVR
jgi:hypothetical protein